MEALTSSSAFCPRASPSKEQFIEESFAGPKPCHPVSDCCKIICALIPNTTGIFEDFSTEFRVREKDDVVDGSTCNYTGNGLRFAGLATALDLF